MMRTLLSLSMRVLARLIVWLQPAPEAPAAHDPTADAARDRALALARIRALNDHRRRMAAELRRAREENARLRCRVAALEAATSKREVAHAGR